ncbi:SRPBCC family protein [Methylococcus sp. Mc7]|uniref:SRPBCC family protein n=1 Tax=Methylococcus sp. Mc7 TaxID=2860258 RepID=UPI001C52863A|nr:SRPBCC family protein [Methylococcus sp. Mc7]QXP85832.1 SRPBCC family protein [Methylococcus sp. Mc7]
MELHMKATLPLRAALTANAVFSLSSALLMLLVPEVVGRWLGIQAPGIFQLLAVGLVVFAAELIYQATRRRIATWRALLASATDFTWVVASIVLLSVFPRLFSPSGDLLVLAVAGAVFVFGAWQLWAAGHTHRTGEGGTYRHCIVVETNAPAQDLWQIVGSLGDIMRYMPSLKRSAVLDGKSPGVGAVRTCEDRAGKRWSEECTAYDPGRSFDVRFRTEAPDFPFPASVMRGGWKIMPSAAGSQVMVWWELTPKPRLLAPLILPLLALNADREFPRIIQRMAATAVGNAGGAQPPSNARVAARLVPTVC